MDVKRKPYKIYMDADGYRFSCRIKGCVATSTHWLLRKSAVESAEDHYAEVHTERDADLEKWIEDLAVGPEELELLRQEVLGAGEVISESSGEDG